MKKQRRGLNRYNMLQDGKKRKKVSIHMHDTLKTNCEEKNQEKKTTKNGVNGIRTHIHKNRWPLVYIYSKNERSTYCAIESLKTTSKNSCELSSNCITSQRPVSSRFSFFMSCLDFKNLCMYIKLIYTHPGT